MPVYDGLSEIGNKALDTGNMVVLDEFWGRRLAWEEAWPFDS
jgi:predicted kinase